MKKWLLALGLLLFAVPAQAQTTCASNLTQAQVLANFADNNPTGISPRNMRDYVCSMIAGGIPFTGAVTVTGSGQFFSQNNAVINRMGDRLFIGGATPNDGAFPLTNKDWLSQYAATLASVNGGNYLCCTVGASLTLPTAAPGAASSATGFVEGAQSAPFTSASTATIANTAITVNNNTSFATSGWAYYGECHNVTNIVASCYGMELDPANHNLNPPGQPDPFQQGSVVGIQDACGAGLTGGTNSCHTALQIVSNTQTFQTGINFMSGSITAGSGAGGATAAISLPPNYAILWDTARSTFGGSLTVNSLAQLIGKATNIEFLNASNNPFFDCGITSPNICTFGQSYGVATTGGQSFVAFSGGSMFWENAGNTDSYNAFDLNGALQFQHGGSNFGKFFDDGSSTGNVAFPHFSGTGSAPTCASTGIGASGTCTLVTGSSDTDGIVALNVAGAGPAASGVLTLTLHQPQTQHGTACVWNLASLSGSWAGASQVIVTSTSLSAPAVFWTTNGAALTAGNTYNLIYHCMGF